MEYLSSYRLRDFQKYNFVDLLRSVPFKNFATLYLIKSTKGK